MKKEDYIIIIVGLLISIAIIINFVYITNRFDVVMRNNTTIDSYPNGFYDASKDSYKCLSNITGNYVYCQCFNDGLYHKCYYHKHGWVGEVCRCE